VDHEARRKLKWLGIGHLVAVTGFAAVADVSGDSAVQAAINMLFTALVGSELCLLGLGMAAVAKWQPEGRCLSLLAKSTCWVWLLIEFVAARTGTLPPLFILLMPPLVTLASFGFGLAIRAWGVRLVSAVDDMDGVEEPFQFTLRHLLAWTGTIAVLLAIARGLRTSTSVHDEGGIAYAVLMLAVICLLTASIVIATLWATLGIGRPSSRVPIAVSLAAIVGLSPAYCFDRPSPWAYVGLSAVAAMLSIIAAPSLLVVRGCGYRLVARRQEQSAP